MNFPIDASEGVDRTSAASCAATAPRLAAAAPGVDRDRVGSRRAAQWERRWSGSARPRPRRYARAPGRCWCAEWRDRRHSRICRTSPSASIGLRDPPSLQGIVLERPEPLLLRPLAQVHPELHDDRAIVGQRPLEGGNLIEQRVELRSGDTPATRSRIGEEYQALRNIARRPGGADRANSATNAAVRALHWMDRCSHA